MNQTKQIMIIWYPKTWHWVHHVVPETDFLFFLFDVAQTTNQTIRNLTKIFFYLIPVKKRLLTKISLLYLRLGTQHKTG